MKQPLAGLDPDTRQGATSRREVGIILAFALMLLVIDWVPPVKHIHSRSRG